MLKINFSRLNWLVSGLTLAFVGATIAPVSAQQVIIIDGGTFTGVSQQPAVNSFIYGSPIPTPMPVNPTTGLMPSPTNYMYPVIRQNIVNPILVNPRIEDSTLINPVIVNNSWRRIPLRGNSRVILTYPR